MFGNLLSCKNTSNTMWYVFQLWSSPWQGSQQGGSFPHHPPWRIFLNYVNRHQETHFGKWLTSDNPVGIGSEIELVGLWLVTQKCPIGSKVNGDTTKPGKWVVMDFVVVVIVDVSLLLIAAVWSIAVVLLSDRGKLLELGRLKLGRKLANWTGAKWVGTANAIGEPKGDLVGWYKLAKAASAEAAVGVEGVGLSGVEQPWNTVNGLHSDKAALPNGKDTGIP